MIQPNAPTAEQYKQLLPALRKLPELRCLEPSIVDAKQPDNELWRALRGDNRMTPTDTQALGHIETVCCSCSCCCSCCS